MSDRYLTRWWDELAAGKRTRLTADTLHLAACKEAEARDYDRMGTPTIAKQCRQEAAAIMRGASEPPANRSERPL